MAATQYQIFCRYYHDTANRAILNDYLCEWVQWEDRPVQRIDDAEELIDYSIIGNPIKVYENMWIRPEDGLYEDDDGKKRKAAGKLDNKLQQVIINANNNSNPKYDMIFMYDGISSFEGEQKRNPPDTDKSVNPLVYYEKMKRVDMCPWFLYATVSSLHTAMEKGEELVRIMGTKNVLIGKVVAIDQYIDII